MIVQIMAGASGSGKTTHINKTKDQSGDGRMLSLNDLDADRVAVGFLEFYNGDVLVLSADDITFGAGGLFHIERLSSAHELCVLTFSEVLQMEEKDRPSILIVDNTNTSPWEIAPYVAMAMAYHDVKLEILIALAPWRDCVKRNAHGTPDHAIRAQARRLEKTLDDWPSFWPNPVYLEGE